jgi:hypothetical protein
MFTSENPSGNITNSDVYRDIIIVAFIGTCILVRRSIECSHGTHALLTDRSDAYAFYVVTRTETTPISIAFCMSETALFWFAPGITSLW